MLIPLTFVKFTENNIIHSKSKLIKDIFNLFSEMIEPAYENRISAQVSLKKFNQ